MNIDTLTKMLVEDCNLRLISAKIGRQETGRDFGAFYTPYREYLRGKDSPDSRMNTAAAKILQPVILSYLIGGTTLLVSLPSQKEVEKAFELGRPRFKKLFDEYGVAV